MNNQRGNQQASSQNQSAGKTNAQGQGQGHQDRNAYRDNQGFHLEIPKANGGGMEHKLYK